MRKLTLLAAILSTTLLSAQDFTTFGLSSNPQNIVQNPGADPMTRFQLRYAGVESTWGATHTAGELFATNDLFGNIIGAGKNSIGIQGNANVNLPHLGFKLGKNYFFAGLNLKADVGVEFDTDLLGFVKYGMADENGDFDGNYSGDFSDTRVRLALSSNSYFGYQRTFLEEKLRVGLSFTSSNYIAGMNLETSNFNLSSSASNTVGNTLAFGYDIDMATTNLFAGASLDSLSDLNADNLTILDRAADDPQGALSTGITLNTFGFGITYRPLSFLETSLSMTGLGGNTTSFDAQTSKVWSGSTTVEGFEYSSAPGDSISVKIGNALDQYQEDLTSGFSTELTDGNYEQQFSVAQDLNATVNLFFTKRSYVGVHYATRTNSFNDYSYLGFNSLVFLGRNLQLKGGYYLALDDVNADMVNLALQARITPVLQVYVGTNGVSDIATIANGLMNSGELSIGSQTSAVNVHAGVSFTLFDKRFKTEKQARKQERESKKADAAKTLEKAPANPETPAEQEEIKK
jgi:hypothetical protein